MKWLSKLFRRKETGYSREFLRINKTCINMLNEMVEEKKSLNIVRIENKVRRMIKIASTKEEHEKIEEIIYLTIEKYKPTTLSSNDIE